MNTGSAKLRTIEIYSVLLVDLCVALVSYFLAHFCKFGRFDFFYLPEMYTTFLLVIVTLSLLYTILINPSNSFTKRGYLIEFAYVTKYVASISMVVLVLLYMLKYAEDYSRLMFGYFCVILEVLTYLSHVILKKAIRKYYRAEKNQTKLLVITDLSSYENINSVLTEKLDIMRGIMGTVLWDGEPDTDMGNKETYQDKVKLLTIDETFIYLPDVPKKEITDIVRFFESMGVVCHYALDIGAQYTSTGSLDNIAGYTVISYSINNVDYNKRMLKRILDMVGALVGVLLTIVLTPFIALAIEIDNPGPVFFKQPRVGRNGRIFNIYKFRSMVTNAEDIKSKLSEQNEMDGLMFKMEKDPRVTKVGNFLRKTSLDEFPQFFNILRGDMSLVGTRPPTVDEYEKYDGHYKRRLSMKPGLTGMWQVSGRSDITNFDEVVALDLEYIDNWSMSLDIKILFKTVGTVFLHKGAK